MLIPYNVAAAKWFLELVAMIADETDRTPDCPFPPISGTMHWFFDVVSDAGRKRIALVYAVAEEWKHAVKEVGPRFGLFIFPTRVGGELNTIVWRESGPTSVWSTAELIVTEIRAPLV